MNIFLLVLCVCTLCSENVSLESVSNSVIAKTNGDTLLVEGNSVTSSDIQLLMSNRIVSKINVHITHTFYVDADLKLNGIAELQIFANTWNITRPVTFDLSGTAGVHHEVASGKGSAGNQGNPGMNGGNFYGLAYQIIGGDLLTVNLNGGNGGDGQDGTASDDVSVAFDEAEHKSDTATDLRNYYKRYFGDRGYVVDISSTDDTPLYAQLVQQKEITFNITLHPRQCCGTTGMGGAGGLGGQKGSYIFNNVGDENVIGPKFITNGGSMGNTGKHALPCKNNAVELRIDTKLEKVIYIAVPLQHPFTSRFTIIDHVDSPKCTPKFVRSKEEITPESIPGKIERIPAIIGYKRFLLESMGDVGLKEITMRTYEAIDSNNGINDEYTLNAFVVEANELETHYFELKESINLLPLYQRLSSRVGPTIYEDLRPRPLFLESMLYTKIEHLRAHSGPIVNFKRYIDVAVSFIHNQASYFARNLNYDDVELRNNIERLGFNFYGNYILDKYFFVIEGFTFSYFPFAADFLETYQLSKSSTAYEDMNEIVTLTTNNLKSLNQTFHEIKRRNVDILLKKLPSNYSDPATAFYIWRNVDIRDKIQRLFAGEKVTFFADIKQSKKQFNAIKFNTIDLVFRSSNQFINDKLNDALEYFELSLNHTGVSAVRCNNNYFKISDRQLNIYINRRFYKNKLQDPYPRNRVYQFLKDNEPFMSPYSLWEIHLSPNINSDKRFAFNQLKQFIDVDVDIELHGTGEYIKENAYICDNVNLPKFYSIM